MLAAEIQHRSCAIDAQIGFERSRFVVDAGMNHSAVVATLMLATRASFSIKSVRSRGKRFVISRATARPTIPPPITSTWYRASGMTHDLNPLAVPFSAHCALTISVTGELWLLIEPEVPVIVIV